MSSNDASQLESVVEEKVLKLHQLDARTLSIFVSLLIVAVLTTWLFKARRIRFIHETGLTLIYGAIVGLGLWIFGHLGSKDMPLEVMPVNSTGLDWTRHVPTFLQIRASPTNQTFNYEVVPGYHGSDGGEYDVPIEDKAAFSPELFYNILLPPIIFHAGYGMKKKQFFRNIGSILAFAVLGTVISAVFVATFMYVLCAWTIALPFTLAELMFFGALISATDPVTILSIFHDLNVERDLFAMVMGESVLNDAVAIVLSQTVQLYMPGGGGGKHFQGMHDILSAGGTFFGVLFGSFVIGAVVGCANAFFTKWTQIKEHPLLESTLFILMSYLSFLIAESFEMSGIVAILFCGMCQAHYTYNNLSAESQHRTKQLFEVANFLAESFVFMYIGVSLFTSHAADFNFLFPLYAIVAVVIARAIQIYLLSFLLNLKRRPKIPMNYQHMLVWAGLRGAIAFALALRNTSTVQRQYIYSATAIVVTITVIFNGGFTQFVIDRLNIKYGAAVQSESVEAEPRVEPHAVESEPTPVYNPWDKSFLPSKWYHFDSIFMKPLLTHSQPTLMETMPTFAKPLARMLTSTQQMMFTQHTHAAPPLGEEGVDDGMGNGALGQSPARII